MVVVVNVVVVVLAVVAFVLTVVVVVDSVGSTFERRFFLLPLSLWSLSL